VHKKVEKILVEKNKEYTNMIKVLSTKIESKGRNNKESAEQEDINKENDLKNKQLKLIKEHSDFIKINNLNNYKIIDKKSMLTEINDKGERVAWSKQDELLKRVERLASSAEIAVISGTLPQGVNSDFYGKLVSRIPKGIKIVIDAEEQNVLSACESGEIFMVKPNLTELEHFSNMKVSTREDMVKASKKYLELGIKYVLVSLGANGAVLTDGENNYYCKSANVAVNSTVGAGDSMVSAVCLGLTENVSDEELLKRATAAGTAAVTTSGTNLFYKDKYDEIYQKLKVEKF
jgi:1-phosphofructokinase